MLWRHSGNRGWHGRGHRAGVRRGDLGDQLAVNPGPAQGPKKGALQRLSQDSRNEWPC